MSFSKNLLRTVYERVLSSLPPVKINNLHLLLIHSQRENMPTFNRSIPYIEKNKLGFQCNLKILFAAYRKQLLSFSMLEYFYNAYIMELIHVKSRNKHKKKEGGGIYKIFESS